MLSDLSIWLDFHTWISLFTLSVLEIVLGIDNLVFISILSHRLPQAKQKLARRLGLSMALLTRLMLLGTIKWMIGFITPLFTVFNHAFTGRDLLLLGGGVYLMYEATREMHQKTTKGIKGEEEAVKTFYKKPSLWLIIFQIMCLDIIFSLDSVITAVGMAQHFTVMVLAVVIAVGVMVWASEPLNRFIRSNPTIEILALSFLLLVGMVLVADSFGVHINRGYVYFAICFSVFVESINIVALRKKKKGWRSSKKA